MIINPYIFAVAGPAYDADAQAYINALNTHITLTAYEEAKITDFVIAWKAIGGWGTGCYYPYIGGTAACHKYNIFNPSVYQGTFYSSGTHSSAGFGGSGFMDTSMIPASVLMANNTTQIFSSATSGAVSGIDIGSGLSSGRWTSVINGWGAYQSDCYNASSGHYGGPTSDGAGVYMQARTSSSVHKIFRNGVQLGTTHTGSSGNFSLLTTSLAIKVTHEGGGWYYGSNRLCTGAGAIVGLTDSQVAALSTLINNFNTAMR